MSTALTDTITWGYTAPSTINVHFLGDSGSGDLNFASFTDPNGNTFLADGWTTYEQQQAELAFQQFAAVANVRFNIVSDIAQADFVMVTGSDADVGVAGYWNVGGGTISVDGTDYDVDGVGVFNWQAAGWNSNGLTGTMEVGGRGFVTLLQEIGHGLGLAHPHDAGGSSTIMSGVTSPTGDHGAFDLNQGVYTTMSLNDGWPTAPHGSTPSETFGRQGGPMALDIAVLQEIYGANPATNLGNTVYDLPDSNAGGTYYQAVWDAGGTDTIRYGGTADAVIDLRAATLQYGPGGGGFISWVAGIHGGVTIAHAVVIENARTGAGDDTLTGNEAANVLSGRAGDDRLFGRSGDDVLNGGGGADIIRGGPGNDRLLGAPGKDRLLAGGGDDELRGGGGNDIMRGHAGNDRLFGGGGNDDMRSGGGDDILRGAGGNDRLFGGGHDDRLFGGGGEDKLVGGGGNDIVRGNAGDDGQFGGGGDDRLIGGGGKDVLRGNAGDDRLFGGGGHDKLIGGGGNDILRGNAGDDRLFGGDDHDRLIGGGHDDTLGGGGGNDVLLGNAGNDKLVGGAGNDRLIGGAGDDRLIGNAGGDRFVFQSNGRNDLVVDFQNDLDRLDFRAFDFADKASVLDLASQAGDDVVFALPNGATVEVNNFDINLLGAEDIII